MLKHLSVAFAPALAVITLAFGLTTARANTCSVPANYPTIQAAVDDPNCTIINVAPGVYNENVTIPRTVTLNGARAGVPIAERTAASADESVLRGAKPTGSAPVILSSAASVIIDGFTIQNAVTAGAATGVQITGNANENVVINDFLTGITTADAAATAQAVYLVDGPDGVNISNNRIQNVSGGTGARAIWIGNSASSNPSLDIFIKGNVVADIASAAGEAAGLLVDNHIGTTDPAGPIAAGRLQVFNNDFTGLTGASAARGLDFQTNSGFSYMLYNTFTALSSAGDVAAIYYNTADFTKSEAHSNDFNLPITAYGIELKAGILPAVPGDSLNAACNWWGNADGPGPVGHGHGAKVSPNIGYAPWKIAPGADSACTGNNVPVLATDCQNSGWTRTVRPDGSTFKNQGDCIQFVNTGK